MISKRGNVRIGKRELHCWGIAGRLSMLWLLSGGGQEEREAATGFTSTRNGEQQKRR